MLFSVSGKLAVARDARNMTSTPNRSGTSEGHPYPPTEIPLSASQPAPSRCMQISFTDPGMCVSETIHISRKVACCGQYCPVRHMTAVSELLKELFPE